MQIRSVVDYYGLDGYSIDFPDGSSRFCKDKFEVFFWLCVYGQFSYIQNTKFNIEYAKRNT